MARLRQTWRIAVLPAVDRELPGSTITLAWASAEVDDADVLQIKIPGLPPFTKERQPSLATAIVAAYSQASPEVAVKVRFTAAKLPPRRSRRAVTEWDVWQPGDPDPSMHEALEAELRADVLSHPDAAITAVLCKVTATAFSQDQVWLAFPDDAAKQAVATTPGAGAALHNTLSTWQGGYKARLYVDSDLTP